MPEQKSSSKKKNTAQKGEKINFRSLERPYPDRAFLHKRKRSPTELYQVVGSEKEERGSASIITPDYGWTFRLDPR